MYRRASVAFAVTLTAACTVPRATGPRVEYRPPPAESPAPAVAAAPPAMDASAWRQLAATDLEAVYRSISDDHPGRVVEQDSALFREWIDQGYAQARENLVRVDDAASYVYLLQGYVGGFRDAHIKLFPAQKDVSLATRSWPRFSTRWVHDRYVVAGASAKLVNLPPDGAELLSCDGKSAEQIARARLDRYEGDLELQTARFNTAPRLLWERGNPFVPAPPQRCDFRIDGTVRSYALEYVAAAQEDVTAASTAARASARATAGVAPWMDGASWWIGLPPSFTSEEEWQRLYDSIDSNVEAIRGAGIIVFDVRGTVGGSSGYAYALARRLWGADMVAAYRPQLGDVVWRVSPANRQFLLTIMEKLKTEATLASGLPYYERLVQRFDEAAAKGERTVHEPATRRPPAAPPAANPVKAKIVVLTDYSCVSACLDFMDLFLALPNVTHAGVSTDADTIFMEANRLTLPSGKMLLDVPHKAWIQRPRRSNEPYVPKPPLLYRGDLADDDAVRRWLWQVVNGVDRAKSRQRQDGAADN